MSHKCPECGNELKLVNGGAICTNYELCGFKAGYYSFSEPNKPTSELRLARYGDSQVIVMDEARSHNRTGEPVLIQQQVAAVTPIAGMKLRLAGAIGVIDIPRSAIPLLIQALQNECK